jgi:GAF domain-containing protein
MDAGAFDEGLSALGQFVVGEVTVGDTLQRVAELTTRAIPAAAYAGITLPTERGPATSVFTHPTAPNVDRAQYDTGRGPCLEAYRTGQVQRIDSTLTDERWPEFTQVAVEHAILSTLSLPMTVGDRTIGALNLYSHEANAFAEDDARAGMTFARQAAVVMANAQAYWQLYDLTESLEEALKSRAVIEQAKGIVMSQSKVAPDEAFQILVRASQRENRKLRDIAQDLVERATQRE